MLTSLCDGRLCCCTAGDFAPSYWATQLMLVALLVMTFTLLPYLTSGLLDALMSTSSYERKRCVCVHVFA